MLSKTTVESKIKKFKIANGLSDVSDENVITNIHLQNQHSLDLSSSCDQSSRTSNDMGIDGWYYDDKKNELYIY